MGQKKILILVGDCVEDCEIMVPFQALRMLGHLVHTVCGSSGRARGRRIPRGADPGYGNSQVRRRSGHQQRILHAARLC